MNPENAHYLFAYGTLRSSHEEHRRFCPNALSVRPARLLGNLFELKEGYPILILPPESKLLSATPDCLQDWSEARKLPLPHSIEPVTGIRLIEGELIELPLETDSLAKTDAWEGFQPGRETTYQRFIAPALLADGTVVPTWVYGAFQAPDQSLPYESDQWIAQSQ
ncbi:MAG: gamma-glutamylcyclotransferase [Opitutaceae bacterium]|nr:gamma-glutamylcyclotransferase [Opitutaceae bacterium]